MGWFSSSAHTRFAHRVQSQTTPRCMEMLSKSQEGLSLVRPLRSMGDVIRFNLPPLLSNRPRGCCQLGCMSGWPCPEGKGWPGRLRRWGWMGWAAGICSCRGMWQASPPSFAAPGQRVCSRSDLELPLVLLHHQLHPFCISSFLLSASRGGVLGLRNAVGISMGTFQ